MPIAVDGSNLLHYLRADRTRVRQLSLQLARREGIRLTVVFDGPPPSGTPARESLGAVSVIWSENRSADDVIVQLLPQGRAARNWSVVTDDRGLGQRVRDRGATVRSLKDWSAKLQMRAAGDPHDRDRQLSADEVAEWEMLFRERRNDPD